MKKSLLFLSLFTALTMASCGGSDIDTSKIALDYGYDYKNDIVSLNDFVIGYDTLGNKIASYESFVLLVYKTGCTCWTDFEPSAIKFMNDYNVKFPAINVNALLSEKVRYGIYAVEDDMPSICFFRRGQLIRQTVSGKLKDNSIFKDYYAFKDFMLENIYLPHMYYLDEDALDEKIAGNEEFNLYVARSECGDCKLVNKNVLYDWSEKNKEKSNMENPLYIFDIQKYRGTDRYQPIKDKYGLSNTEFNPIFGYNHGSDQGMIPTFQRWKNGRITDMITVLNDYLGANHTFDSYFTEERVSASPMLSQFGDQYVLNGIEVEEKYIAHKGDIEYLPKDPSQMIFHNPIVELYLSTYVK